MNLDAIGELNKEGVRQKFLKWIFTFCGNNYNINCDCYISQVIEQLNIIMDRSIVAIANNIGDETRETLLEKETAIVEKLMSRPQTSRMKYNFSTFSVT